MLPRPCGVYSESYAADSAWLRTRGEWILFAVLVAIPVVLPFLLPSMTGILTVTGISLVVVLGLFITTGMAGQINLGQGAFMGVGAYCAAALAQAGMPLWLVILGGGTGAAVYGTIFGAPALRVKGFYLAVSTIAAQMVFQVLMVRLPKSIFGGSSGLGVPSARILGINLTSETQMYYLVLAVTAFMLFGAYNLTRSRVGRALVAVRDNDLAAEILGVNLVTYKILAFATGAFYAGVGGALWAYYTRFVLVDQFTLWQSLWYVGMLIVGGTHLVMGAILGTVVVRLLEQGVTILGPSLGSLIPSLGAEGWFALMNVILGGLIIIILIFEPRGLGHRLNILRAAYGIWPFRHGRG